MPFLNARKCRIFNVCHSESAVGFPLQAQKLPSTF
jgi:hypothetical protein